VTVKIQNHQRERGRSFVLAEILQRRVECSALGFEALKLVPHGTWRPEEQYWGEKIEDCFEPVIAGGPRPRYEMEQVIPGSGRFREHDPILDAVELTQVGAGEQAQRILMELLAKDLRCLDAYSHLGLFHFDLPTFRKSVRYFEVGTRIGELSLGANFNGVLPWSLIDNRPFLRCLHGYALCLWRDGEFEAAARELERLLWLVPTDNLGVRFILEKVRKGVASPIQNPE
jgi:hypothetical protein